MDISEFSDGVAKIADLHFGEIDTETGTPFVEIINTKLKTSWKVPLEIIFKHSWPELEEIFTGRRDSKILKHMTRVVGYYSDTDNWNKSKIAELADRHKGDYKLPV